MRFKVEAVPVAGKARCAKSSKGGVGAALLLVTLLGAALRLWHLDSLPPGLWYDEALVTRLAMVTKVSQFAPVYFESDFGGIHPLLIYTTIFVRWLAGNHPLAIRYGTAALGALSVPVLLLSVRAVLQLDDGRIRRASLGGLLAALISAFLFPSLLMSRVGVEVTMPALGAAIVFWMLSKGLHTGQWHYFLLLGLALGVSLYTYQSARFLPIAVALASLWSLVISKGWRRLLPGLTLGATVALVVYLPLLLYFLGHPSTFVSRAGTATYNTLGPGASSVPLALVTNAAKTLAGFSVPGFGDALARHNIPGRQFFDPFLSVLFWLGIVTLAAKPHQRSSAILLSWAGIMTLPVVLTDGAPTFTRMMGAVPALVAISAVGALMLVDVIAATSVHLANAVLVMGLSLSLVTNTYDYFGRWANDPRLFDAFQVGDWQAAILARDKAENSDVYLSSNLLDGSRPTFDVVLPIDSVRNVPGPDCLVYPNAPDRDALFVVDVLNDPVTVGALKGTFRDGQLTETIHHQPEPFPLFQVFRVPAGSRPDSAPIAVSVRLGDSIGLSGFSLLPTQLRPGDLLTLTLYWQALSRPEADYTVFAHLYSLEGESTAPAAQSDGSPCNGSFPTSLWRPGEVVLDKRTIALPKDFSGDTVVLSVGMYSPSTLERLPVSGSGLEAEDNRLRLVEQRVVR